MVILFLFLSKVKRDQLDSRMKAQIEIKKEVYAFPLSETTANWSIEDQVDSSYKTIIYTIPI
jgi:hypothetical protein